jgi:hypothetical protein
MVGMKVMRGSWKKKQRHCLLIKDYRLNGISTTPNRCLETMFLLYVCLAGHLGLGKSPAVEVLLSNQMNYISKSYQPCEFTLKN